MSKPNTEELYSPEDYRSFINFLLDRIEDPEVLRTILAKINRIFCDQ